MRVLKICVVFVTLIFHFSIAFAMTPTPIPEESGFSGFITVGASCISMKSNLVAGNTFGGVGHDTISSVNEKPGSETSAQASINGDLRYTFGSTGTQINFGTMIEDYITFDLSTVAGIRQRVPGVGMLGASYLFSGIPAEVWQDPYLVNAERKDTERKSSGGRFSWDYIFGTMFNVRYAFREIEIDKESSGSDPSLGLTAEETELLDRNGKIHDGEFGYTYRISPGNVLNTTVSYIRYDLDGDSRSRDMYQLQLTYTKNIKKFMFITNAVYSYSEYDEENPIFNKTQEADNYGLGLTVFYLKPFNLENWSIMTNFAGYKEVSNIDFYDGQVGMANLSLMYRF